MVRGQWLPSPQATGVHKLGVFGLVCWVCLERTEHVYDIRYIVDREKRYCSAELMVAGGGPTIWVSLDEMMVQGYWGGDKVLEPFTDNLDLDGYCEEMYGC